MFTPLLHIQCPYTRSVIGISSDCENTISFVHIGESQSTVFREPFSKSFTISYGNDQIGIPYQRGCLVFNQDEMNFVSLLTESNVSPVYQKIRRVQSSVTMHENQILSFASFRNSYLTGDSAGFIHLWKAFN